MALEDAKLFHKDIYAFIVDFTSAFNTTDHGRMLWILYARFPDWHHRCCQESLWECHHPSQASLRGLHRSNTSRERHDPGRHPLCSPFLFLLYTEPLLWWLHVGGRGYVHTCIPKENELQTHLANKISSASFADLLCPMGNLKVPKVQANKLTLYSNWAGLIISGSKTKVTGSLNASSSKDQLKWLNIVWSTRTSTQKQYTGSKPCNKIHHTPSSPFLYLGVTLTTDLN